MTMSKKKISFNDKIGRLIVLVCVGVIVAILWSLYLNSNVRYMRVKYLFTDPGPLIQARIPTNPPSFYRKTPTSSPPKPEPMLFTTYISKRLGIAFSYLDSTKMQKFLVKEEDNKIYLYWEKSDYKRGYSLEVLHKNPQDNLLVAITTLLRSYPNSDCIVSETNTMKAPATYKTAIVTVTKDVLIENRNTMSDLIGNCPQKYITGFIGKRYFMMSPQVPEKLVFISLGQDNWLGSPDHTWDETVEISASSTTP